MAKKEIVIIGIGRFASELIKKLNKTNEFNIVAIDTKQSKLEALDGVKNVVVGDATAKGFLTQIGIENADYFVIGMGQDFEASLVIASIIRDNFKGKIIAKSIDEHHERILNGLGIENVVTPEVAAAGIVYRSIINPFSKMKDGDLFQLVEVAPSVSIVNVPAINKFVGIKVKNLNLPKGIGIALISKPGVGPEVVDGDTLVEREDILLFIGRESAIIKLTQDIADEKSTEDVQKSIQSNMDD